MSITWNGISSDTIGVIVERIPNRYVPTRRFSPQQVAGRNGNILLVDKAFPNVEQEYEVYLSAEAQGLPSVARACAEWLMGPDGYCRLQDSYDTTVYREAFLMGGYDLENILNKFGRCTITFSCKPQKYLLTGDTPIEIPAGITTYTGDVVQFDGVTGASITSLSTTITPTQDLHGYDSPWPAGGGVNKFDKTTVTPTSSIGVAQNENGFVLTCLAVGSYRSITVDIPFTGHDGEVLYLKGGIVNSGSNNGYFSARFYDDGAEIGGARERLELYPSRPTHQKTVPTGTTKIVCVIYVTSSASASVNDTTTFNNIILSLTDSAYSPYSNICPISGRTGLSVYRTGKNLFDKTATNTSNGYAVNSFLTSDGAISSNGSTNVSEYIKVSPSTDFVISGSVTSGMYSPSVCFYDISKNFISGVAYNNRATIAFTTPANAAYLRMSYNKNAIDNYQLELGSTATTYEPYNGNTYAVDWTSEAGTVYGGTLDVVTGVLTVDRALYTWSSGGYLTSSKAFALTKSDVVKITPANQATLIGAICDSLPSGTWTQISLETGVSRAGCVYGNGLAFRIAGFTTAEEYTAFLANNPLTFAYLLATPLTYQLTAQEIEVLVGENNVWTSSGPVSVTVEAPFVGTVTNPTPFEARPMLEVSGVGEITINGKSIQILEAVSDFQIDCETMEAEDNSKIYCMDFPELSGGENEIAGDGSITALTVTPRWWTL